MNVSLTPELEKKVEEKVASGLYGSASELVREALRLFFQAEEIRRGYIEDLNRKIDVGLAEAERGAFVSATESRRRTRAIVKRARRKSA